MEESAAAHGKPVANGRYWARTSDPQLVEPGARVPIFDEIAANGLSGAYSEPSVRLGWTRFDVRC
jgi:hypothetical protein